MKLSLILLLLLLTACNRPATTATPAATDTRTATETSTPAQSPTITPDVVNLTYFPEWRCIWYANEPIELRRLPESKYPVVMTLQRDGTVHLTGYAAREHVADDTFVQVGRVNGLAVDPPLWIIKTRVDVVNGVDREVLFPDVFDCNLPATPTEEAPQASATPEFEAWQVVVETLNIRPDCSTNAARIGTAARDQILATLPGAVIANGFEWRRLAASKGCIAVRAAGGTVYAREIVQ